MKHDIETIIREANLGDLETDAGFRNLAIAKYVQNLLNEFINTYKITIEDTLDSLFESKLNDVLKIELSDSMIASSFLEDILNLLSILHKFTDLTPDFKSKLIEELEFLQENQKNINRCMIELQKREDQLIGTTIYGYQIVNLELLESE